MEDPGLQDEASVYDGKGLGRALTEEEFSRYSRQMIVPGVGKDGQLRLLYAKVLIIGAGGLGCPAAQYIAGAGIGTIGIVDGDVVEVSNLHRQVGHATTRIGMLKVDSLIKHLEALNSLPAYIPYATHINPQNAADIISGYDLVMDCTDNPATRYLISDVCVLLQKPLVSAASVQKSGQLLILNCPPAPQGLVDKQYPPCYRCCFPKPPPSSSMVSCGEAGILGTVVGMMGVAQAGEVIKILASGLHHPYPDPPAEPDLLEEANLRQPFLLIYSYDLKSGPNPQTFRALKMASRRKKCFACGENSPQNLTLEGIKSGTPNYEQFCTLPISRVTLPSEVRITASAYHDALVKNKGTKDRILIDTREKEHFSFGSIEGAVNVPFTKLLMAAAATRRHGQDPAADNLMAVLPREIMPTPKETDSTPDDENKKEPDGEDSLPIFVVCRRGLDSQEAVEKLREMGIDKGGKRKIMDIIGGMKAWKEEVDPTFPYI